VKDRRNATSLFRICEKMPLYKKLIEGPLKDANHEILLNFFQGASHQTLPTGAVLMVEDDTHNSNAYVLLRGAVGIFRTNKLKIPVVKKTLERQASYMPIANPLPAENSSSSHTRTLHRQATTSLPPDFDEKDLEEAQDPLYAGLDKHFRVFLRAYGKLVDKIRLGNIFGEVALVTDSPRTASAITLEETELMVFSRETFNHIKKFFTQNYFDKKVILEKVMPQLADIKEYKRLTQLVQSFQDLRLPRVGRPHQKAHVTREGRPGRYVYVLIEGSVRVYKKLELKVPGQAKKVERDFPLTEIEAEAFIGEELLFSQHDSKYRYTVRVESRECKLLAFERNANLKDYGTAFLARNLKAEFLQKLEAREAQLEAIKLKRPEKTVVLKKHRDYTPDKLDNLVEELRAGTRDSPAPPSDLPPSQRREFTGMIRKFVAGHKKVVFEQNPLKFMYDQLTQQARNRPEPPRHRRQQRSPGARLLRGPPNRRRQRPRRHPLPQRRLSSLPLRPTQAGRLQPPPARLHLQKLQRRLAVPRLSAPGPRLPAEPQLLPRRQAAPAAGGRVQRLEVQALDKKRAPGG